MRHITYASVDTQKSHKEVENHITLKAAQSNTPVRMEWE